MKPIGMVVTVAVAFVLTGCRWGGDLDTRTYELKYLDANEAAQIIDPYVYGDRPDAPGALGVSRNLLTVRETPDNLEKIARVLAQYDRPVPSVRLRFQVIEANGTRTTDPGIADVENALKDLFRFEGFRLLEEAVMGGAAGTSMQERLHHEGMGGTAVIEAAIREVRAVGDSGTVRVEVRLILNRYGPVIETGINLRAGQTVILGKAKVGDELETIILTVRAELIPT